MFNIILFVTRNSKNKHYSKIIYWYMHASKKLFKQYGTGSFFVQNFKLKGLEKRRVCVILGKKGIIILCSNVHEFLHMNFNCN